MFSWGSSAKVAAAQEEELQPKSYDPLKGNKGAVAFYDEHAFPSTGTTLATSLRLGSAAGFYQGVARLREEQQQRPCPGVAHLNWVLREGRRALLEAASSHGAGVPVKVVVGNSDADIDATAASLVYAYALHQQQQSPLQQASNGVNSSSSSSSSGAVVAALLCVRRDEFRLRTDAEWLLRSMGVDVDALLFANEVDLRRPYQYGRLDLTLVGQSEVPPLLQGLESAIKLVIPSPLKAKPTSEAADTSSDYAFSGSTLVAKKLSEDQPEVFSNVALCRLLLAAILQHSNNLDPTQSSTLDGTMAAFLIGGAQGMGRNSLYEQLREKKYNQNELSTEDLLRADYTLHTMGPGTQGKKGGEVLSVGVSSIGLSLADMVGKDPGFTQQLRDFISHRTLHALVLFHTYWSAVNKRLRKELVVISPDLPALQTGLSFFLQQERHGLKLRAIIVKGLPSYARGFSIGNGATTRATVEQLLRDYFDNGGR